jgi:hypothetical protein
MRLSPKSFRAAAIISACLTVAACQTVTQFVDNHLDTNLGTFLHPKSVAEVQTQPKQTHTRSDTNAKSAVASVDVPTLRGKEEVPGKQPIPDGLQPDDLRAPFGN